MKILLVISSLESGGAETHVCALAAALVSMGHSVTVAAEAGRLSESLKEHGAEFVPLTATERSFKGAWRTMGELRAIIRSYRPDIVHAHTRMTAFVCGILRRRHKFRLIVTTHALYAPNRLYDRAAVWGDRTVAVSCDIKSALIENCGVDEKKITVIGNGIDTVEFSPAPSEIGEIKMKSGEQLPLSEVSASAENDGVPAQMYGNTKKQALHIVFVSRLDSDCSLTASLLCFIAPEICAFYPQAHITVVGGGTELEKIKSLAAEANEIIGYEAVKAAGECSDIVSVLRSADIFVGVSRAALEAMACDIPVILSGNEGYLGILTSDILPVAESSNFCCRGCPAPSSDKLKHDLLSLCRSVSGGKDGALKFRNYILERHSIDDMAKRTLDVYREAMNERRILIGGYYGYGNSGDDSVLMSMLAMLPNPKKYVTVLAHNPRLSERRYGVRCAPRFNPFSVLHEMRRADVYVSGGGSLLQDISGRRSLFYYLSLLKLSRRCGAKTVIYANGIGPLKHSGSRKKVARAAENADYISLRSEDELVFLESIGVPHTKLSVSADPAILTGKSPEFPGIEGNFAVVALREKCLPDDKILCALNETCDSFGVVPVFLPMQPSQDLDINCRIRDEMNRGVVLVGLTPEMTVALLARAQYALTMRMHLLVFSSCAAIPAIGISDDPKFSSFAEYSNQPRVIGVDNFSDYALKTALGAVLENREAYVKVLSERRGVLTELAKNDISNI